MTGDDCGCAHCAPRISDTALYLLRLRAWLEAVSANPSSWGRSYDALMVQQDFRLRETAAHLIGFMAA